MSMLKAADIKSAGKRNRKAKVSVPEWAANGTKNAHVYVRMLRGSDAKRAYAVLDKKDQDESEMQVGICILCICDAQLRPLLSAADKADLLDGPIAPLTRCAEAAMKLNGWLDDTAGN